MSIQNATDDHTETSRRERFLAVHHAGHERIYRYFRRRARDAATAEDLCAEVFRIAWEKSAGEVNLSIMFLFGISKNVLRNHNRSLARSEAFLSALAA